MSEVAVLVPVLARPAAAAPLAESLRATSDAELVWIISPGDAEQRAACEVAGGRILEAGWEPGPGDYARKINLGYRETIAPWVLQAADDLRFHPGWERAALAAGERGAGVVGTDDLGNPTVRRGAHSTHSLVRRSYVESLGGTYDSREVLHEGYDHQFVDTELVDAAQARGAWAFAKDAKIEHLHPFWRKGSLDATYRKALAEGDADRRLFLERQRAFRACRASHT